MGGGHARVLAHEGVALVDEPEGATAAVVERIRRDVLKLACDRLELAFRQRELGVSPAQALHEAVFHEWLVNSAVEELAVGVIPLDAVGILLLEERDDCLFKFAFGELAVFENKVLVHGCS